VGLTKQTGRELGSGQAFFDNLTGNEDDVLEAKVPQKQKGRVGFFGRFFSRKDKGKEQVKQEENNEEGKEVEKKEDGKLKGQKTKEGGKPDRQISQLAAAKRDKNFKFLTANVRVWFFACRWRRKALQAAVGRAQATQFLRPYQS